MIRWNDYWGSYPQTLISTMATVNPGHYQLLSPSGPCCGFKKNPEVPVVYPQHGYFEFPYIHRVEVLTKRWWHVDKNRWSHVHQMLIFNVNIQNLPRWVHVDSHVNSTMNLPQLGNIPIKKRGYPYYRWMVFCEGKSPSKIRMMI